MSLLKPQKPDGAHAHDPIRVRAVALRLLARREHSVQELTDKLTARGFGHGVVLAVVDALRDQNLLSDRRFVEEFVAGRVRRGSGPIKIRDELRRRCVDLELVETTLDAYVKTWVATAAAARHKHFGSVSMEDYAERMRQARFLQQRGFTPDQIRQVLKDDVGPFDDP